MALAQELVTTGQNRSLPLSQRSFAYMPYMHSESALVHTQAILGRPSTPEELAFLSEPGSGF